jgi:hypothetical protein
MVKSSIQIMTNALTTHVKDTRVAQLVERQTLNLVVAGSSPVLGDLFF